MVYFRCIGNGGAKPTKPIEVSYLKWQITKTRSIPAANALQIAEFYLYLNNEKYSWNSNVSITTDKVGESGQEIDKLIDGNVSTKYCSTAWGSSQVGECNIIINLGETISLDIISSYSFVTAGDESSRDPISWKMYGSIDGINWSELDSRNNATVPETRAAETTRFGFQNVHGIGTVIYKGTNEPLSALGNDGQIYLEYNEAISDLEYISNSSGSNYIKIGSFGTKTTKFEVICNIHGGGAFATPIGARISTNNQAMLLFFKHNNSNNAKYDINVGETVFGDVSDFFDKKIKIILSNDVVRVEDENGNYVEKIPSNTSEFSSPEIALFNLGLQTGVYGSDCDCYMDLYECKVYENGDFVKWLLPKTQNNTVGLIDAFSGTFYPAQGTLTGTARSTPLSVSPIKNSYAKVSGRWNDLIATDISKIGNTIEQTYVNFKQGTFTSASTQYGIVDVNVGFRPDLVIVRLPFSNGDTVAYWDKDFSYGETQTLWSIVPEGSALRVNLDRTTGETGIQAINDNGFSFMSQAANTRNVECSYTAIKYENKEQGINKQLFTNDDVISGYYIDANNGNPIADANSKCTDFVDCSKCSQVMLNYFTTWLSTDYNAWYDENKTRLEGLTLVKDSVNPKTYSIYNVPNGAKYFRISWSNSDEQPIAYEINIGS